MMRVSDLTPWIDSRVIERGDKSEWKPGPWQAESVCAQTDPEAFYPEKGQSNQPAKAVCRRCPVRDACLAFAVVLDDKFGIWGGLSPKERDKLEQLQVPGQPGVTVKLQKRLEALSAAVADVDEQVAQLTAEGKSAAEIEKITGIPERNVTSSRKRIRYRASVAAERTEQVAEAA